MTSASFLRRLREICGEITLHLSHRSQGAIYSEKVPSKFEKIQIKLFGSEALVPMEVETPVEPDVLIEFDEGVFMDMGIILEEHQQRAEEPWGLARSVNVDNSGDEWNLIDITSAVQSVDGEGSSATHNTATGSQFSADVADSEPDLRQWLADTLGGISDEANSLIDKFEEEEYFTVKDIKDAITMGILLKDEVMDYCRKSGLKGGKILKIMTSLER